MEHDESPALRAMAEEVRAEQPEVDWARVEARLFDESGEVRGGANHRDGKRGRTAMIASGLALAAAFAIALMSPTRAVEETTGKTSTVAITRPALVIDDGR